MTNVENSLDQMEVAAGDIEFLAAELLRVVERMKTEALKKAETEKRAAWDTAGSFKHVACDLKNLLEGFEPWRDAAVGFEPT